MRDATAYPRHLVRYGRDLGLNRNEGTMVEATLNAKRKTKNDDQAKQLHHLQHRCQPEKYKVGVSFSGFRASFDTDGRFSQKHFDKAGSEST